MARTAGIAKPDKSLKGRFDSKWVPEPFSGCWLWTAGCSGETHWRYGQIKINGVQEKAHRVSWKFHHGEIPYGLHVLHKCDTPLCVNPDHLYVGTPMDNSRDKFARGRHVSCQGERNGNCKLTEEQVLAIRNETIPVRAVAKKYGIGKSMAHYIRTGKNWSYLCH